MWIFSLGGGRNSYRSRCYFPPLCPNSDRKTSQTECSTITVHIDRSLLSRAWSWLRVIFFFPQWFFFGAAPWNMQNPLNRVTINRRRNITDTDYVHSGESRRRVCSSTVFSSPPPQQCGTSPTATTTIWVNIMRLQCICFHFCVFADDHREWIWKRVQRNT